MNIYYPMIVLLLAAFCGLVGISLFILPINKLTPEVSTWYKKIIRTTPLSWTRYTRPEPSLRGTGLNHLQLMSDTQMLLFEERTFDYQAFSILYLMAPPGQPYTGYTLWQVLTSQKLRHGKMKIFHAYDDDHSTGHILFSVTNALEPGYFDVNHIDKIKVPGLCLFMHHDSLSQPLRTFENMLKVAKRLEHLLDGTLCDNQRQPLSESKIQSYHNKLSSLANREEQHHG